MDKHYYLVSQLPYLTFSPESPITKEYFLKEARKWLSAPDFLVLSKVAINDFSFDKKDPLILREYKQFESSLRQRLSFWRKSKEDISRLSRELAFVKSANPLEAEIGLLRLRWEFIEEKEWGHYFDLEFLIMYFLKMQLKEILATFNKEAGRKVFEKLCEVSA